MSLKITERRRYNNGKKQARSKPPKPPKILRKKANRPGPRFKNEKIRELQRYGIRLPIGPVLNHLRTARGLSMSEIEKQTGISHSIISELESGQNIDPSGSIVARLCQLFDVPIQTFYSGAHHESK